jgi:subtilisin family serine protease
MVHTGKIHQLLAKQLTSQSSESPIRVIVKYREHVAKARAVESARLPQAPSRVLSVMPAVALAAAPAQIEVLGREPDVERIWPDLRVHTCLDVSARLIGAPEVWDRGHTGAGIGVAVLDTGVDLEHPDFAGRIAGMADFTGEGVADLNGHGTHVAGIACGDGRAHNGAYTGIAPCAYLYVAKVLDRQGAAYMSDVMAGLDWAIEQDVHVINLSLSGPPPGDGSDALSETCDLVVERGFVVCVAAGNSGPESSTIGPPGCARQVITVGASTDDDTLLDASSRGPTSDGRTKPDVVFPGLGIVSCRAQDTTLGSPLDLAYTEVSGTSMATPHASGLAALLLEDDPGLTPVEIKELMTTTAVDLGCEQNVQGAGRGDAAAAVAQAEVHVGRPEPGGCLVQIPQVLELLRHLW